MRIPSRRTTGVILYQRFPISFSRVPPQTSFRRQRLVVSFDDDTLRLNRHRMTSFHAIRFSAISKRASEDTADSRSASVVEESDEELIAQMCEGEKRPLAILFRRYARLVHAVGRKILKDEAEADDLVQDVFLSVFSRCKTFDNQRSSVRSWIVQTAHCRGIDRRRRLTACHYYTRIDLDCDMLNVHNKQNGVPSYEKSLEGIFGKKGLKEMFETLSDDQRETLRLHFFEGYSFNEIAAKMGQSSGNIRNHFYRGLDRLRRRVFASK
jgi:RNA polymerase sigma-70 factor, ECF subfamily